MAQDYFPEFEAKMRTARMSGPAIKAFHHNYSRLLAGETGSIPEAQIEPVANLPEYTEIVSRTAVDPDLLSKALVVKLNGGLGTSMGLERANVCSHREFHEF